MHIAVSESRSGWTINFVNAELFHNWSGGLPLLMSWIIVQSHAIHGTTRLCTITLNLATWWRHWINPDDWWLMGVYWVPSALVTALIVLRKQVRGFLHYFNKIKQKSDAWRRSRGTMWPVILVFSLGTTVLRFEYQITSLSHRILFFTGATSCACAGGKLWKTERGFQFARSGGLEERGSTASLGIIPSSRYFKPSKFFRLISMLSRKRNPSIASHEFHVILW